MLETLPVRTYEEATFTIVADSEIAMIASGTGDAIDVETRARRVIAFMYIVDDLLIRCRR
jgi:hypothetical protein